MAEKGETKILAIITICVILFSIGLSGCIEEDDKEIKIEYRLKIETNTNNSYIIVAPIFSNEKLRSKIEIIKGHGDISFVNANISDISDYSSNDGIEIRGNSNAELYGKHIINYDGKKHTDDELSLKNSYSNYWTWCDKNDTQNITIKIEASFATYTDGERWYSISDNDGKIKLEAGWNLINIKENGWES